MTAAELKTDLESAPLSASFDSETWGLNFERCAGKVRDFIRSCVAPRVTMDETIGTANQRDGYSFHRVLLSNWKARCSVSLLKPDKPNGAGVLCLHGHSDAANLLVCGEHPEEKIRPGDDFGRQLVRQGYTVAAPCLVPFGTRGNNRSDRCGQTAMKYRLLGRDLAAENLRDVLASFDFLCRQVDGPCGVAGFSLGANIAIFAAAALPVSSVSAVGLGDPIPSIRNAAINIDKWECGPLVLPGLLNCCDVKDALAALAPTPVALEMTNLSDGKLPEDSETLVRTGDASYKARGCPMNFTSRGYEGTHRWHGEAIYGLFERVMRNA